MNKNEFKPPVFRCCICEHLYHPDTPGSAIEVGTTRRFCKDCFSDLLRVNNIRPEDFLDEPEILPIYDLER